MMQEAHKAGMVVHPYTLRADALPPYATDMNQLLDIMYNQANVDGLFSDFPDMAVKFLEKQKQHK